MFEALYYQDRLQVINPRGDVGVVTLWTPPGLIANKLRNWGIDLQADSARIAVLGNLYGNGLAEMLINLLYNPQIGHLLILGRDLAGSRQELLNFFTLGVEPNHYLGRAMFRIIGTEKHLDGSVLPEDFQGRPLAVRDLSMWRDEEAAERIRDYFATLPVQQSPLLPRVRRALQQVQVQWYPSHPGAHSVLRRTPLEAWQEVIFLLLRFGQRRQLRKGERLELHNCKVIVEEPVVESEAVLARWGFSLAALQSYQQTILDGTPSAEQPYTYGNRLRGYFQAEGVTIDALAQAVHHLQEDEESRRAYISLWDSRRDILPGVRGHPCLVTLFFRKWAGCLTLTATFRSHNALDGWLRNCYGLMAIQQSVAEQVGMPVGSLTLISHSLSIDPQGEGLSRAQAIAAAKKSADRVDPETGKLSLRTDPHGEFVITIDREAGELVVQHLWQGQLLHEYRGRSSENIEKQLARDCALSEISHALYLGRELARWQMKLQGQPLREE
ncbi:thymidylate synthase [Candidatus Magnetaquicoccus inordinatus]|uniref:thymidylate synthase n=1 Tax=Candidatus Magnetaquicoccus inordinatus TaxID=2496818 RepID=UPI00102B553C|nr:thymidylate synthase [Candidatus Magnetaquicoccus inordinatus]